LGNNRSRNKSGDVKRERPFRSRLIERTWGRTISFAAAETSLLPGITRLWVFIACVIEERTILECSRLKCAVDSLLLGCANHND
jgi:hypothetical protein